MKISYLFRESLMDFRRTGLASISSVITITISLLFIGLFYLVSLKTTELIKSFRQAVEFEVFLDDPITPQLKDEVGRKIEGLEGVEKLVYVSKEDAARIFKEEFGEEISAVLDFNPLPASYKITTKEYYNTPARAEELYTKLSGLDGVNHVTYRKELLRFVDQRAKIVSTVSLIIGIFLALTSIVLVSNTIRLAIHAKQKSMQAMELVGASRLFIRTPLLVSGIIQGLAGGLLSAFSLYGIMEWGADLVSPELSDFFTVQFQFYFLIIGIGILLGVFGSVIAVRKYLKKS